MKLSSTKLWRTVHIYVSMAVLLLFLFFALTGLTLNHPEWQLSAGQQSEQREIQLPASLWQLPFGEDQLDNAQQAARIATYLREQYQVQGAVFAFDYQPDEKLLELDFKQPAGYTTVQLSLSDGRAELQREFSGWLHLANDLHKGRYAGASWRWLNDGFALACLVFAISGFYILWRQPARRRQACYAMLAGALLSMLCYLAALH